MTLGEHWGTDYYTLYGIFPFLIWCNFY